MVCVGTVRNGRVELEPGYELPEGIRVRIEPVAADADPADDLSSEAVSTGLPDLATEHDHYIYSVPRRGA